MVSHPSAITWTVLLGLALVVIAIGPDGDKFASDRATYTWKIVLAGLTAAPMTLMCAFNSLVWSRTSNQPILSFLALSFGCVWSASTVFPMRDLGLSTNCSWILVYLVLVHCICKVLLFPGLMVATWGTYICWGALTLHYRRDNENSGTMIAQLLIALLAQLALSRESYLNEERARRSLIHRVNASSSSRKSAKMTEEAMELRSAMFNMIMEKYDIADLDRAIDLKSPVEKAMSILLALQADQTLPNRAYLQIKQVVTYLGSGANLFKPQLQEQLQDRAIKLDTETERWIVSLVQQSAQAGAKSDDLEAVEDLTASPGATGDEGAVVPAGSLVSDEERKFQQILASTEDWDFDVFTVVEATKGRPLFFLGMALFHKYNLISTFNINIKKLQSFLTVIEAGYHSDKPYHNSTHAADVTRTVHYFLTRGRIRNLCTDVEMLAAIIASTVHDFDHPGKTNQYHIVTRDPKAILYNDRSVLENHHAAQAFFLLLKDENNILENLSPAQWDECRKLVIDMVLATDLSNHFEFIGNFKTVVAGEQLDTSQPKSRHLLLKMALKCADVGHAAKALPLHKKWTLRVIEEFYRQGDDERKKGIPLSPFMDRQNSNVPKAQIGFIDFLVKPMYDAWVQYLKAHHQLQDDDMPCLKRLLDNREHWKGEAAKDEPALDPAAGRKLSVRGPPA